MVKSASTRPRIAGMGLVGTISVTSLRVDFTARGFCRPAAASIPSGFASRNERITRAGMPPARLASGIVPETMLPAVITDPAPIDAPGSTVTRPASHVSAPIVIGADLPPGVLRSVSSMMQYGPMLTLSPSVTRSAARIEVP